MIIYNNKKFKKIISNNQIKSKVLEICDLLNDYYKKDELIIVCVLNGAVMVLSEILNNLTCNYKVDYIELSSYKGGTETSNKIDLIQNISVDIKNKKILIIEDIVDTGTTLDFLYKKLNKMEPDEIKVFSLLFKRKKYKFNIDIDWYGFEIEDIFAIGYGMDYDLKFRGLNDIYALS